MSSAGGPFLDRNPAFEAWVASLDDKHWARYDLSACRLGWEAATAALTPVPDWLSMLIAAGVSDDELQAILDEEALH